LVPPTSSEIVLIIIPRGVEPLTGEDIAEIVVFAAGRRENVVIADTLVFPNHQVCVYWIFESMWDVLFTMNRPALVLCTASHKFDSYDNSKRWMDVDRV